MNKLVKRICYLPLFALLQLRLRRARREVEAANMTLTLVCLQGREELVNDARDILEARLTMMGCIRREISAIWD